MRIPNWTKMNAATLWQAWRRQFDSDVEATAVAIWVTNRLIKESKSKGTKRRFYSIKDHWLSKLPGVGRKVRLEKQECFRCEGTGFDERQGWTCPRCEGRGVWRERWLYTHEFSIAGQHYSFHSYVAPNTLLDGMGDAQEVFGSKFTEQELAELALPMSGMMQVLIYVAAAIWGLRFNGARYEVPKMTVGQQTIEAKDVRHWWV